VLAEKLPWYFHACAGDECERRIIENVTTLVSGRHHEGPWTISSHCDPRPEPCRNIDDDDATQASDLALFQPEAQKNSAGIHPGPRFVIWPARRKS